MAPDHNLPFKPGAPNPMLGHEPNDDFGISTYAPEEPQSFEHDAYGAQECTQRSTVNPSLLQISHLTPTITGYFTHPATPGDLFTGSPMDYRVRMSDNSNQVEDPMSAMDSLSPVSFSLSDFSSSDVGYESSSDTLNQSELLITTGGLLEPLPSSGVGVDSLPGSPNMLMIVNHIVAIMDGMTSHYHVPNKIVITAPSSARKYRDMSGANIDPLRSLDEGAQPTSVLKCFGFDPRRHIPRERVTGSRIGSTWLLIPCFEQSSFWIGLQTLINSASTPCLSMTTFRKNPENIAAIIMASKSMGGITREANAHTTGRWSPSYSPSTLFNIMEWIKLGRIRIASKPLSSCRKRPRALLDATRLQWLCKLPFRSSSVKAMGSSLFSRSRRDDTQKSLVKQSGESRRRRASVSTGDRRTSEFQRPSVAKDFRSHEVQQPTMPPPSASSSRIRSMPRSESASRTSRGSASPHSRQNNPGGRDEFYDRPSRSPPRRRYSSSEVHRPDDLMPQSPIPSRSQLSDSRERRDRPGYGSVAAAGAPPSSPHAAQKSEWNGSPREARQELRRYPPSASSNNRSQPDRRGSSPYHRPSASSDRNRSASVDGYDGNAQHNSAHFPSSPSRRPKNERRGSDTFFSKFPTSFATYAGIRALSEHADKAKEWVEWFNSVNDAPDEIRALSKRITTARDTIQQMKDCLEARPDLIEDETGQALKSQIEDAIDSTSKTLKRMTKLLASFSGAAKQDNTALGRLEGFWHSYNYKSEGEELIKSADAELQQQLMQLGTLMSNIYALDYLAFSVYRSMLTRSSRALKKPAPSPAGGTTPHASTPSQSSSSSSRINTALETSRPAQQPATSIYNRPPPTPQMSPKSKGQFEATRHPPKVVANPPTPPRSEPPVERPPSHGSTTGNAGRLDPRNALPHPRDILLDAAWEGDVKTVANCIRQAPPSSCDIHGLTPLHLAVERDHMAVAMFLLDHGADVHARADGGCMPLHLAARYASAATVEMLIDRGKADPNCQTTDGRTALHYAARSAEDGDAERREVIRALRDLGANPTLQNRRGELPRDVAQKRDYWDAAATLRRAEQKWEQQQDQKQQQQQQQQDQQRELKHQLKEVNTRERNAKKEGNWLQRYGLKK
ncbi:ankyrin [Trichoderma cornu-damae]|uniref:Ankyrin n=1 Tax=Trichoderma cornu-damae TaxID=654480 RepID=A0A9P8QG79_9HYPO|nr:ankyrin [Trichoderma cornu-damae]